jgi:hypothetical protein
MTVHDHAAHKPEAQAKGNADPSLALQACVLPIGAG